MIRLRNVDEIILNLTIAGTQTTTTTGTGQRNAYVVPFDGYIKAIYARLGTAGTTNTQTTDLKLNGTTLAASGTVLSFATTSQDPTYAALTSATPSVSKGNVLTVNNTAVHTTPAVDCCILVVIQKARSGAAPVSATITGSIDAVI